MSGNDELQWLWPLLLVLLTFHVQILNSLVAVIHCFSFGQWQAVLSRVAEALWGVVLHCALQLPPLSTASYLQLELVIYPLSIRSLSLSPLLLRSYLRSKTDHLESHH